jgi:hypothetical protein
MLAGEEKQIYMLDIYLMMAAEAKQSHVLHIYLGEQAVHALHLYLKLSRGEKADTYAGYLPDACRGEKQIHML